jgi:hypothetical protein
MFESYFLNNIRRSKPIMSATTVVDGFSLENSPAAHAALKAIDLEHHGSLPAKVKVSHEQSSRLYMFGGAGELCGYLEYKTIDKPNKHLEVGDIYVVWLVSTRAVKGVGRRLLTELRRRNASKRIALTVSLSPGEDTMCGVVRLNLYYAVGFRVTAWGCSWADTYIRMLWDQE